MLFYLPRRGRATQNIPRFLGATTRMGDENNSLPAEKSGGGGVVAGSEKGRF